MQKPKGFEKGVKKTIRRIVFSPRENPTAKLHEPTSSTGLIAQLVRARA